MLDDDSAGLGVDFTINPSESYVEMARLVAAADSAEGRLVAGFGKVEAASANMVKTDRATASIAAFADTTARDMKAAAGAVETTRQATESLGRSAAQMAGISIIGPAETSKALTATSAINATEKAIERRIFAITKEATAIGRTKAELRDMADADLIAKAATQENTTASEDLYAALRNLANVRRADAENRHAVQMAAEAAAMREEAAAAALYNGQLLEQSRLQAALDRTNGADRPRATNAGATYSALSAKLADDEARASAAAAMEVKRLADGHARLAALVQGSNAAQQADAAAAEHLRESTDSVYAATKRLNAQIAESTRLYHSGATAPEEYARQQAVLTQRLGEETGALGSSSRGHQAHAGAAGLSRNAQLELTHVIKASAEQMAMGAPPLQILTTHLGQLGQIATMTEGGVWGLTKALGGMVASVLPIVAPLAIVAGVAFGAFKQFQSQVKDSGELTRYRDGLGLTHKEMLKLSDGVDKAGDKIKKLDDVTVTAGDVMAGLWKTIKDNADAGGDTWDKFKSGAATAFGYVLEAWNITSASITAGIYGTVNAAKVIWSNFSTSVGDVFYQAVNVAISAMNALVKAGTDILNGFIHGANKIPGVLIGELTAPQMAEVANPYAGKAGQAAAAAAAKQIGDGYIKSYADARKADAQFWHQVGTNSKQHAKDRMKEEADALKANRTPAKPKVDHNALNAEAVEAQIKNLYKLATAYGVSEAAALIAEAREKAESKAIKARAVVEAAVAQQVRLAVAQRVADAAKSAASLNNQAAAQEQVNAQVAAGLVPEAQAAQALQDRLALLPLLAAQEAARTTGDAIGYAKATAGLVVLTAAQQRDNDAKRAAQFISDQKAGDAQLDQLRLEASLIGATDDARVHALAALKATAEAQAKFTDPAQQAAYVAKQLQISDLTQANKRDQDAYNASLTATADQWDIIAGKVQAAGQGMADAFGTAGKAIGDMASIYATYQADRTRAEADHTLKIHEAGTDQAKIARENTLYALRSSGAQVQAFGDAAAAAKGFFKEGSNGYKTLETAEKAFRLVQFALSVRAIAQDAIETGTKIANSVARIAVGATEAVVNAIKSLPFPLNLAAGAATVAALASIGVSIAGSFGGGGKNTLAPTNSGTGTVLGDTSAKSDSIKNAIDALKEVDTVTNTFAREMSASLKSIDSQIGGVASLVVRSGNIDASAGVTEGFKANAIGSVLSKIPVIGGILGGLFGSKTSVIGTGLSGGPQSVGSILGGGFDASYYSDIEKKKKLFGLTTSTKYSTQYTSADAGLENQFTLILKSFNDAIAAAAGPLGVATGDVQARLNGFIVNIGKIDLKGLTGAQIEEKLSAVFGAAADGMAAAAFPGLEQFQKVGEGVFETLVRVASTVEAVGASLDLLGTNTQAMGIGVKLALADQFDSVSALTDAAGAYFETYYSKEEQAAAKMAQMSGVFASLGLATPATLSAFRQLVEAQDLTTAAGQATYATLLKLAPAFADLQASMEGAKSAADIASERQDLQRQLLELQGDTAAIRALDLAKLDASNRALQQQIYAIQDAQAAATAAKALSDAWTSVGDSIMNEVKRIRGLTDAAGGNSFATLQGQFNAATSAARGGDQDAAKNLPALSQALLTAAAEQATSRQELARVQAATAASLEATYGVVTALAKGSAASIPSTGGMAAVTAAQPATVANPSNDNADAVDALREEVSQMRSDLVSALSSIAGSNNRIARKLDDVTAASGGDALSTRAA